MPNILKKAKKEVIIKLAGVIDKKKKLPKDDVLFKNIFSSREGKDMLKEFLEEILQIKIEEIEVQKEVETAIMNTKDKYGRFDLQATINRDTFVIIEMQNRKNGNMANRALYYASKIVGSSLNLKETYDAMKKIIVISILDYKMIPIEDYCTETVTVENKYRKYEIINGIKYYFIELPKFRETVKEPQNKLEEWLSFIDYEREEMVEMAVKNNELVKKAKLTYEYLTGDEAVKRLQYLREKAILDENSAYAEGKKIGEKRGKLETAKAMLKRNIEKKIIMECTGLNSQELNEIFANNA